MLLATVIFASCFFLRVFMFAYRPLTGKYFDDHTFIILGYYVCEVIIHYDNLFYKYNRIPFLKFLISFLKFRIVTDLFLWGILLTGFILQIVPSLVEVYIFYTTKHETKMQIDFIDDLYDQDQQDEHSPLVKEWQKKCT